MKYNEKLQLLIPENKIHKRVHGLAAEISHDFQNTNLIVIGLLQGSFVFLADLIRSFSQYYPLSIKVDFMTVGSYGAGTQSSGQIKLLQDIQMDISHQKVLLVDDIFDTGQTLNFVLQRLKERKPVSIKTCVLLQKDVEKKFPIKIDYLGFQITDEFVVGYGLDFNGRYRERRDISILSFC